MPSRTAAFRPISTSPDLLDGWTASAAQKPRKRSLAIAGHRTSISLEEPFWDGLKAVALEKRLSVAALVAAIDAVRGEASLSSAIRLFVYNHFSAPALPAMRRAAFGSVQAPASLQDRPKVTPSYE